MPADGIRRDDGWRRTNAMQAGVHISAGVDKAGRLGEILYALNLANLMRSRDIFYSIERIKRELTTQLAPKME